MKTLRFQTCSGGEESMLSSHTKMRLQHTTETPLRHRYGVDIITTHNHNSNIRMYSMITNMIREIASPALYSLMQTSELANPAEGWLWSVERYTIRTEQNFLPTVRSAAHPCQPPRPVRTRGSNKIAYDHLSLKLGTVALVKLHTCSHMITATCTRGDTRCGTSLPSSQ